MKNSEINITPRKAYADFWHWLLIPSLQDIFQLEYPRLMIPKNTLPIQLKK